MMRGHFTTPGGVRLSFETEGRGPPVLWQHGLGAGFAQPAAVFPALPVRRITLACRGHEDSDTGPEAELSIATFTRDILALLEHLGIGRLAAAGGISLGAAIALRLAALHGDRLERLILARPAWVSDPAPPGLAAYAEAGRCLAELGPVGGEARFRAAPVFRAVAAAAPDNAASLLGFFTRPRPDTTTALLRRLPRDGPGISRRTMAGIALPTLVIGTARDLVHPLAFAEDLAATVPNARLALIPAKSDDAAGHVTAFRAALADFLLRAGAEPPLDSAATDA